MSVGKKYAELKKGAQPLKGKKKPTGFLPDKDDTGDGQFIPNRHAGSTVYIEAIRVFSFGRFNRNRYWPDGPKESSVPGAKLTALERGHVYDCEYHSTQVAGKEAPVVRIRISSLRICDEETADLLKGLEWRNEDPDLVKKALSRPEWDIHQPKALQHMFSIPPDRLDEFRARVEGMGGKVSLEGVDKEKFLEIHDEFLDCLKIFDAALIEVQQEVANLGPGTPLAQYDETLSRVKGLEQGKYSIFQLIEMMSEMEVTAKKIGTDATMITLISGALGACRKRVAVVRDFRVSGMLKEVQERMAAAGENRYIEEGSMYPLRFFFDGLRHSYSVLTNFSVASNEEIHVPVGSSKIIIRKDGIRFEGRKSDLERMTAGITLEVDSIGDGDRFSGL